LLNGFGRFADLGSVSETMRQAKLCDLYAIELERKLSRAGTIVRAHNNLPRMSRPDKLQPWQFPRQVQSQLRGCDGRKGSSVVKRHQTLARPSLKTFPTPSTTSLDTIVSQHHFCLLVTVLTHLPDILFCSCSILTMRFNSLSSVLLGSLLSTAVNSRGVEHGDTVSPDHVLRVTLADVPSACESRQNVVVNGTTPGPAIRVLPGTRSWIRVYNDMDDRNLSMVSHSPWTSTSTQS
jgi:hypothetical protein